MKEFNYNWDWIKEVGNFIENDPFMQSHRGREYAIKIGLIKEVSEKAITPQPDIETEDFKQRTDNIIKRSIDDITSGYWRS